MKFFDTFTGIGGFTKGILDVVTNAECVGYSEIDKYAISIYKKHYPNHKNYGDITKINTADLPDFDLLVGGFPCQAFSMAGKRKGFEDARGTLFFDLARILRDKRPRHFIFENVKGLLSHENGKTIQTIFGVLTDLGYEFEWQLLNSKNFKVPQNRERIYIIGHIRGECRPKVFPITSTNRATLQEITINQSQGHRIYSTDGLSVTLTSLGGGCGAKTGLYSVTSKKDLNRKFVETPIFGTLTATYYKGILGDGRPAVATPTLTFNKVDKRQNGKRFNTHGRTRVRRLTPLECERLQAFPDNWTKEGINEKGEVVNIYDTQRYKCCGNSITVNVVKTIIKNLYKID